MVARLKTSAQFQAVFRHRRSCHGRFFSVHAKSNDLDAEVARLGLAVSKKAGRRAVERNRIRRQVRESFRLCRASLGAVDFVVAAKPGASSAPNAKLRGEIDRLWLCARAKCESLAQQKNAT